MTEKKRRPTKTMAKIGQTPKSKLYGLAFGFILLAAAFLAFKPEENAAKQFSEEEIAALPTGPSSGALAPDFTLKNMDGQDVSLSAYQGKPVAMMFFHSW
jgi:cytochrome oxidase Cu insertion factor (SCO1/SenC/PrrC family)